MANGGIVKGSLVALGKNGNAKVPLKVDTDGKLTVSVNGQDESGHIASISTDNEGMPIILIYGEDEEGSAQIVRLSDTGQIRSGVMGSSENGMTQIAVDSTGRLLADKGQISSRTLDFDYKYDKCDRRYSIESGTPLSDIIHWMNIIGGLVVIRYIAVKGTTSPGTYTIQLSDENTISGAVAPGKSLVDRHIYKATTQIDACNISSADCDIVGLIVDMSTDKILKLSDLIINNYMDHYISDELYPSTGGARVVSSTEFYVLRGTFTPRTLDHIHLYYQYFSSTGNCSLEIQLCINNIWTTIYTDSNNTTSYKTIHENILDSTVENVTGFGIVATVPTATGIYYYHDGHLAIRYV